MTLAVSIAQSGSNNVTMRNRIINGGMVIDQRNAGAVQTSPASNSYTLDRWLINVGGGGFNVQQTPSATETGFATRVAAGFTNYLAITSTAVTSASNYNLRQFIEGFNSADLAFGTSSAKTITLSFWVYSSLTGTFGGSIQNDAGNRSYVFQYTIASANTWQQVTATIPGDTSGTWIGATNGRGLVLYIAYSTAAAQAGAAGSWTANDYRAPTGQTNVVGTNGATFYITGIQLEAGTTATPFENRLYGTELALCQRYYEIIGGGGQSIYVRAYSAASAPLATSMVFAVAKRAAPTLTKVGTWAVANCAQPTVSGGSTSAFNIQAAATSLADTYFLANTSSEYVTASIEL
jgi:hypothetical protein